MENRAVIHGCLVEVSGTGVIITGESGVGKTTVCIELVKFGHNLVADDSVAVWMRGDRVLGSVPSEISGLVAIRGVGVIHRKQTVSFRKTNPICIDLVVELVATSDCAAVNITTAPFLVGIPYLKMINSHSALTARSIESLVGAFR